MLYELITSINNNIEIFITIFSITLFIIVFSNNFKFINKHYINEGYNDRIWKDITRLADERFEYNTENIFAIVLESDYPKQRLNLNDCILPCYFRTKYVYGISIESIQKGDFEEWYKEQVENCQSLFTFNDYTEYLLIINQYIEV